MNFFDAQDRARRATRWLVVVYVVSTALIVLGVTLLVAFALAGLGASDYANAGALAMHGPLLAATAIGTALFIVGASLYKTAALSSGGGKVAASMGGTLVPADVSDPTRRRLRNVVEEMAIASGVPVPEIYVLEAEAGINAFAAGFAPGDAAIAVTRGTLELLDRDELQGVIAHEFSHILNGDMRLNIRMMGVLFGIMVLGLIGRLILRGTYHGGIVSGRRDKNGAAVLVLGLGLTLLGGIGVFFARLIKASVSRQREYLADASAVQFTRQTDGIAGALKKIGGYTEHSYLTSADPEEISHMLFGTGSKLSGLFATHPPLVERIQALDASFDASRFPAVDPRARPPAAPDGDAAGAAGFAAAVASGGRIPGADDIVDSVGNPADRHVEYAEGLRRAIPQRLYDAAHSPDLAFLLAIALVLDPDAPQRKRQCALIEERLGPERRRAVEALAADVATTGPAFRLPLLEILFPALKLRPAAQLAFLLDLVRRLVELDGRISLYEYCVYRILQSSLDQSVIPGGRRRRPRASREQRRLASRELLALIAARGRGDAAEREQALKAGLAVLGDAAPDDPHVPPAGSAVATLDRSLDVLRSLDIRERQLLLRAISATVAADRRLDVAEAELVRVVCATLDCPLPPMLVAAARPE